MLTSRSSSNDIFVARYNTHEWGSATGHFSVRHLPCLTKSHFHIGKFHVSRTWNSEKHIKTVDFALACAGHLSYGNKLANVHRLTDCGPFGELSRSPIFVRVSCRCKYWYVIHDICLYVFTAGEVISICVHWRFLTCLQNLLRKWFGIVQKSICHRNIRKIGM